MIEISHLTKKYGDHVALDDLSLTVESGRIYGFLGPNGAGKSTTMNIITGYIGATSGSVIINGHDILKDPIEAKKCIGYLPEMPPLYQDMTVEEYLFFVAELKGVEKKDIKDSVNEVCEITGVSEIRGRLIKNLSKGYKQRVGLSQAMINLPEIIILDEPTVGLDPKQIIEMRELIRSLGKSHTVILSSHILTEVSEICDYVFIISKGKLVASEYVNNLENLVSGGMTLTVSTKGEKEDVLEILDMMDGIEDCVFLEPPKDSVSGEPLLSFVITLKDKADIRETLSLEMAKRGLPVMELKVDHKSLEDVFLALTDDDLNKTGEDDSKEVDEDAVDL